jgi:RNA polymerase sigma-70 factor (ECF subfamily)
MTAQRAISRVTADVLSEVGSEERDLALAFKRGERDAYLAIHERYEARVLSVCRRMLGNPDDAQEAAQEAFIRIYQGLPRFNGRYRLGAWIVRIATNICLDQLRSRSRNPSDLAPLEVFDLESEPRDRTDPELLFLRNAQGRRVRKVLDSLPPMHRAAIVLRDFEGVSYADIAETLGITECQVKALLHRARKGFRRSWHTGIARALLPIGLFRRTFANVDIKAEPNSSGDHLSIVSHVAESAVTTSQQITASASHATASCGGLIQQCGSFIADKAAPVFAAVMVGTATVGAGVVTSRSSGSNEHSVPHRYEVTASGTRTADEAQPAGFGRAIADSTPIRSKPRPVRGAPEPEAVPAAPLGVPVTEPSSAPTPAPSPEPTPSTSPPPVDQGGTPIQEPPPPPPEPEGFRFAFGLDMASAEYPCTCMTNTNLLSSIVGVSKSRLQSVDQVITGSATAAGTPSFGLWLRQVSTTGQNHRLNFSLLNTQGSYTYRANGSLIERSSTEWGGWVYTYAGTYELSGRPARADDMPVRGTYSAELVVSWRQAAVVDARFSLAER